MASLKQTEANRRNALKSTGPTSEHGKMRSRRNAIRHGLTAETVIEGLEDPKDYKAFEANVISDYDAQTAVGRELVLRLASLLWRLRRATSIETGLLQIQSGILREFRARQRANLQPHDGARNPIFGHPCPAPDVQPDAGSSVCRNDHEASQSNNGHDVANSALETCDDKLEVARCFMRLANFDNGAFERLSRYETALWRQVGQTLFALGALRSRDRYGRSYPPNPSSE